MAGQTGEDRAGVMKFLFFSSYLHNVGSVETINTVNPENSVLLTNRALFVLPTKTHFLHGILNTIDEVRHVLKFHSTTESKTN